QKSMTDSDKPGAKSPMVDMLYDQVKADIASKPKAGEEFFNKMADQIDNTPDGLKSTFGRMIADDPKSGMMMFAGYGAMADKADQNGMGSLFKNEGFSNLLSSVLPM